MFFFNDKINSKTTKTPHERPLKSIIKAITWRIVGTLDTMVLSWLITGKLIMAFSIGSLEVFSKMFLYFLHERAWASIRFNRLLVYFRQKRRGVAGFFRRFFFQKTIIKLSINERNYPKIKSTI